MKDILNDSKAVLIALTAGVLGFALSNLTIGFLAGLMIHYGLSGIKKLVRV